MNEFKRAREEYESTPIPEELDGRVRAGIRQGKMGGRAKRHGFRWGIGVAAACRRTAGSVAACLAVLMAGLNVSPTFAAAAADVPVLGGLFQVLTIRDYETVENGIDYKVTVPGVESEGDLAEKVNAEIQKRVDAHLAKAQADWDDYKEAFLATGGTEEEWADREMNVLIDYEIKSQTDTTVSFVVDFAEGWVAAMQQRYCYNLDLANDKDITLADVLGEDWVGICNDAVNAKIAADESGLFFTPEQGGFTTVDLLELDLFTGAAALYNDAPDYATTLTAHTPCRAIFFPQATVDRMLGEEAVLRRNYLRYLSGRIRFLSGRLQSVTQAGSEGKLARYLLANARDGAVNISATDLARRLGLSRASLYRAFEALEKAELIRRTGKTIEIPSLPALQSVL